MIVSRLILVLALAITSITAVAQDAKERSEIPDELKWDLASMYASDDAWEADFERLQGMIPEISQFKGRLAESGESLLAAIQKLEELSLIADNLYVFSGLKSYEDQRISEYSGMFSRARSIYADLGEETAFFNPELLAIPDDELAAVVDATEGLHTYRHYLDEKARTRPYTLSEAEEKLLAMASDPMAKFQSVFSAIDNADLTFGEMEDAEGNTVELTKGRYGSFLFSKDRRVRKDAWVGLFEEYETLGNSLAANYEGHVKSRIFFAKARGYDSALHASMFASAIPVEVYTSLITAARDGAEPLQRYVKLRQEQLGLDTMQVWDLYAPMVDPTFEDVEWEDAKNIVASALSIFGDDYMELYWRGFDEGWVDALENRGKRGGAYSWGTYTSKPYLSMNYEGTLSNVSTLAHEYGHSLHSWMSDETQPYAYANYRTFIAEVASMTNEALLIQKMLAEAETREQKIDLLQHHLDQFRSAFFRQVSFADFEMQAHAKVEAGEPLTKQSLNELYADIFEAYYSDSVYPHSLNASEWSRIPHFLRTDNFYVYQYATSFAAATALAKGIIEEGEPARDRFMALLRSGSSDYPIELLKKAGVDMTTPQPIYDTIEVFEALVTELEQILAES